MTAFVLGNGISRAKVDVNRLLQIAPVYGCNALYRTHTPTVLVATDAPIAAEIQESGYSLRNRFHTRAPLKDLGAKEIPREYFGFSSGPIAVALAAQEQPSSIYLLGFDMGPTDDGKFNNIYADTQFYKKTGADPTYAGNWAIQLKKIMLAFPSKKFVRVCGPTTADIPEFSEIKNLRNLDVRDFILQLNR